MKYIPPFDLIRRSVEISTVKGKLRVNVSYDDFIKLLKSMLAGIEVDETWYLQTYDDIARAVSDGSVKSAKQHFIDDGYFEGRWPFAIQVDEGWYLQQNQDVAESVRRGIVESGQAHFQEDGYREGRTPFDVG